MKLVLHCVLLHSVVCVGVCASVCPVCLRSCDMYKSLPLSALSWGHGPSGWQEVTPLLGHLDV